MRQGVSPHVAGDGVYPSAQTPLRGQLLKLVRTGVDIYHRSPQPHRLSPYVFALSLTPALT